MALNKISSEVVEINVDNYIESVFKAGNSLSDLGWSSYVDSAGVNPVDGLGGSPNITTSLNTSSPLSGDADLRIVKDAVNRQGQGIGYNFTIENRHLAKVLQITFDMELISGTYASGDLRVSIIQDPTGTPVVLEPVGTSLELGIANQKIREIATFQTHVSVTSYRLCIHVSSTSASAYTVDFANFKVWEPSQSIGSIITDWQNYTPTFTGLGTVTSIDYVWRRVGGYLEVIGRNINGTCTGVNIGISLPSGLVAQSNGNVYTETVGELHRDTAGDQYTVILLDGDTSFGVGFMNGSNNPFSRITGTTTNMSSMAIRMWAKVRIKGWGSNVAMSSDSGDGRVVSATITGSLNTGASPTVNLTWSSATIINDTHSAFNGTTGYTAPISGFYQFNGQFNTDSANGQAWNAWVSGSNRQSCGFALSGFINVSGIVFLLAGQNLTFRPNATGGNVGAVGTGSYFTISRVSAGSQVIATQETVSASYYSAATQTSLTAQINFGARLYDTHGAVTTGVGAWKFTAPMSGKYLVTYNLGASTSASYYIEVWKTGSLYRRNINGGSAHGSSSFQLNLLAGEYFDLRPLESITVSGSSSNDGNRSFIEITRIGN